MSASVGSVLRLTGSEEELPIWPMGISEIGVEPLDTEEDASLERFRKMYVTLLESQSKLVAQIFDQLFQPHPALGNLSVAQLLAGYFKKKTNRTLIFPCRQGDYFCPVPLIPQIIRPNANFPSDYPLNGWQLNLTAGKWVYLLGSETTPYKPEIASAGNRFVFAIAKSGILEIGSTPKLDQLRIVYEGADNRGAFFNPLMYDVPLDKENRVYVYPLTKHVLVIAERGIIVRMRAVESGVSEVRLVGIAFADQEMVYNGIWSS